MNTILLFISILLMFLPSCCLLLYSIYKHIEYKLWLKRMGITKKRK